MSKQDIFLLVLGESAGGSLRAAINTFGLQGTLFILALTEVQAK